MDAIGSSIAYRQSQRDMCGLGIETSICVAAISEIADHDCREPGASLGDWGGVLPSPQLAQHQQPDFCDLVDPK